MTFCWKVAYKTEEQAKEARKTLKYKYGKFINAERKAKIYKCPNCFKYHLTTTGY